MIEFNMEDGDGADFSILDRAKIEDLEIGDKMQSESGAFEVRRLKNGYHVLCGRGKHSGLFVFHDLEELFEFLEDS